VATGSFTTLELQLLRDLGAVYAPRGAQAQEAAARLMQDMYDPAASVFELDMLGPKARAVYLETLGEALAGSASCSDNE
jgi:hypothetical protein